MGVLKLFAGITLKSKSFATFPTLSSMSLSELPSSNYYQQQKGVETSEEGVIRCRRCTFIQAWRGPLTDEAFKKTPHFAPQKSYLLGLSAGSLLLAAQFGSKSVKTKKVSEKEKETEKSQGESDHKSIITFSRLREEVLAELNHQEKVNFI
jgi:hypothetical protein